MNNIPEMLSKIDFLSLIPQYESKVAEERKMFQKYQLIDTGKTPSENMNVNLLPKLSRKAKNYGFETKLINMIVTLDSTNENIILLHKVWDATRNNEAKTYIFNTWYHGKAYSLGAYIISDIKRFMDDIISMCWMLDQKENVVKIEVDSIGRYISDYDKQRANRYNCFDQYIDIMRIVNDFANSYKHSIPNNMTMLTGALEPCIFALYDKHNKNFENPELTGITVNDLVKMFNAFYRYSFDLIEHEYGD